MGPAGRSAREEVIPTAEEFEMVIVGGGPGGYAAALYGASAGMHIAMIEEANAHTGRLRRLAKAQHDAAAV